MCQLSLTAPVTPSFPPLSYQDVPVLTTEMLAQAYEVEARRIRQNFANNRERFVEGKHFFILSGNDLRAFKNSVENFDSVRIAKNVNALTLWTERGAARNALPPVRKPGDMFSPALRTGLTAFQSMEDCAGALDYSLRALESSARTMLALGR